MRLLGFERVELAPGETQRVTLRADARLLARFDGDTDEWVIAEGDHHVIVGTSAEAPVLDADVALAGRRFGP